VVLSSRPDIATREFWDGLCRIVILGKLFKASERRINKDLQGNIQITGERDAHELSTKGQELLSSWLVGGLLLLMISGLPPLLIALPLSLFMPYPIAMPPIWESYQMALTGLLMIPWNIYLKYCGISIRLMWIPAWLFGILVLCMGVYDIYSGGELSQQ
jgi:hypothetical protein